MRPPAQAAPLPHHSASHRRHHGRPAQVLRALPPKQVRHAREGEPCAGPALTKDSLGGALTDTLDSLITERRIEPQLAMKILINFDKAVADGLLEKVKARLTSTTPTWCTPTASRLSAATRSAQARSRTALGGAGNSDKAANIVVFLRSKQGNALLANSSANAEERRDRLGYSALYG
jgi:hypothetical protein